MSSSFWRVIILVLLTRVCLVANVNALEIGEKPGDDDLAALLGEEVARDFDLLNSSHVSPLTAWDNVKLSSPPKGQIVDAPHWQQEGALVMPLDEGAISTLLDIPQTASYRVYLRHQLGTNTTFPVTLSLIPQTAAEAAPAKEGAAAKQTYNDAGAAILNVFGQ
jgi:hypothetical protein